MQTGLSDIRNYCKPINCCIIQKLSRIKNIMKKDLLLIDFLTWKMNLITIRYEGIVIIILICLLGINCCNVLKSNSDIERILLNSSLHLCKWFKP